jgi:hypothetical protein
MRLRLLKLRSTDAVLMGVTRSLTANLENAGNTDLSQPPATCCIISVADDEGLMFTQRLKMGSSHSRDETSS